MLVVVAPGQGSQSPGFLTPWLEVPGVRERLEWLSVVSGVDLVAHGTVSDADTIRDTAVAQPLIVGAGLVTLLSLFPHPGNAFARIGAGAGHSVGEITAAVGAGVLTAEQAMVFVRERGRQMAAAAAVTPTGMSAVLGGDPDVVVAKAAEHGLTAGEHERRRPDRRRRHPRPARGLRGRPARGRPRAAARGGRRLPHPAHGAGGRASWAATPAP